MRIPWFSSKTKKAKAQPASSATAHGFKVSTRPVSARRREMLAGEDITTSGGCRTVHTQAAAHP